MPVSHLARPERHGPTLRCQFKLDNDNDATIKALEARRADDETAAIAVERIHSGAAEHKEDRIEALKELGIQIPTGSVNEDADIRLVEDPLAP